MYFYISLYHNKTNMYGKIGDTERHTLFIRVFTLFVRVVFAISKCINLSFV